MSTKPSVSYKLSPNEEAAVLRSQREERRKARLVQVREQEKEAASRARDAEREKREGEKRLLQDNIQSHLQTSHAAELAAVEQRYTSASRHIGLGHRQAQIVQQEESRLHELRLLLAAKQRERARDRHAVALKEELSRQQERRGEKRRQVERLRLTREQEGKRDRENASQFPTNLPIIMDLVAGKGRRVRLQEVEGYSSSYYHLPSCIVQRAASLEKLGPDAQQMAELMSEEMQTLDKQYSAVHEEQKELARLRYMHALNKVKMEKERKTLMDQLKVLEREDRALRQKAIATIPSNIHQPLEQRMAVAREQQRDMEQAFERLFVSTHGVSTRPHQLYIAHPSPPVPTSTHHEETPTSQTTTDDSILEHSTAITGCGTPDSQTREMVHVSIPTALPLHSSHTPELFLSELKLSVSELTLSEASPQPPPIQLKLSEAFTAHSESLSMQPEALSTEQEPTLTESNKPMPREPDLGPISRDPELISTDSARPDLTRAHRGIVHTTSGARRLVTVVQTQQQAWTQRLAERKNPVEDVQTKPLTLPPLCDLSSYSHTPAPGPLTPATPRTTPNRAAALTLAMDSCASPGPSRPSTADIPVSQPPFLSLSGPHVIPAPLPRPDLSLVTADSDSVPQDSTTSLSNDPALSLDTTPTLCLPIDVRSDSEEPPLVATTTSHKLALAPPLSPSSLQTAPSFSLPSTSTASLQEAFLRRKMIFVKESQRRLEELKSNARERQAQSSLEPCSRHSSPSRHSPRPRSSSGVGKENVRRVVTFSSPVLCSSHTLNLFNPPLVPVKGKATPPHLSRRGRKISSREMKERSLRFYSRLPEVNQKKLEEKRSAAYESNRQKAKAYQQQQARAKMQKKTIKIGKTLKRPPFK